MTTLHVVAQLLDSRAIHEALRAAGRNPDEMLAWARQSLEGLPKRAGKLSYLDTTTLTVLSKADSRARRDDVRVTLAHLVGALAEAGSLPKELETWKPPPEAETAFVRAPSITHYLASGRDELRSTVRRLHKGALAPAEIARLTLAAVGSGLADAEAPRDLIVETREQQLEIKRAGGVARLLVALDGEHLVLRIERGPVPEMHRFTWDANARRWSSPGLPELFAGVAEALRRELYA